MAFQILPRIMVAPVCQPGGRLKSDGVILADSDRGVQVGGAYQLLWLESLDHELSDEGESPDCGPPAGSFEGGGAGDDDAARTTWSRMTAAAVAAATAPA